MAEQLTENQAKRRILVIVMAIVWLAALIITPYYIAKPALSTIDQERVSFMQTLNPKTLSHQQIMALEKPYREEYARYLASVYATFSAIWIIFPLIGLWVAANRRKRQHLKARRDHQ
ncbi:MAG: hypothetical protein COV52_08305 [Gammaproteobacteria bacterium CG11_big_fil_rev_8_21_14_0_20_46_22]|nr:MAG: hypothetical protein COW05_06310 [Gammaproteobacteria bacterium CG12_big_fil_rev_8_21_14_0_65_46_12]PIR10609.1 MAG: hypothetical protein COV52_08305 [Gammaproteobacteria bacterium CG11_big_fil_rev_8_21_14_0_20_46_22]